MSHLYIFIFTIQQLYIILRFKSITRPLNGQDEKSFFFHLYYLICRASACKLEARSTFSIGYKSIHRKSEMNISENSIS